MFKIKNLISFRACSSDFPLLVGSAALQFHGLVDKHADLDLWCNEKSYEKWTQKLGSFDGDALGSSCRTIIDTDIVDIICSPRMGESMEEILYNGKIVKQALTPIDAHGQEYLKVSNFGSVRVASLPLLWVIYRAAYNYYKCWDRNSAIKNQRRLRMISRALKSRGQYKKLRLSKAVRKLARRVTRDMFFWAYRCSRASCPSPNEANRFCKFELISDRWVLYRGVIRKKYEFNIKTIIKLLSQLVNVITIKLIMYDVYITHKMISPNKRANMASSASSELSRIIKEHQFIDRTITKRKIENILVCIVLGLGFVVGVKGEEYKVEMMTTTQVSIKDRVVKFNHIWSSYTENILTYEDESNRSLEFLFPKYDDELKRNIILGMFLGEGSALVFENRTNTINRVRGDAPSDYYIKKTEEMLDKINPTLKEDTVMRYMIVRRMSGLWYDGQIENINGKSYSKLGFNISNEEIEKFNKYYSPLCEIINESKYSDKLKDILKVMFGRKLLSLDGSYILPREMEAWFNKFKEMIASMDEDEILVYESKAKEFLNAAYKTEKESPIRGSGQTQNTP